MRQPVTRLLHVLLSVPVLIAAVIAVSPSLHASAASAPVPLVIVIDPGHGGTPNPAQPDMPFDPGAIAPSNGLMEKDATLQVSKRLQALLQADGVDVVLTRSDDRNVTVEQRSATANDKQALLFLSIHFNSYLDSSATGSLVLYPKDTDLPFATAMSAALTRDLTPLGVGGNGVRLRDNWWLTPTMPVATVEPAYLSNPHEASLIADPAFQQALASSLRSGMEQYQPVILQRKAEIVAWNAAHPVARVTPRPAPLQAAVAAVPKASSPWLSTLVRDVLLVALLAAVLRWPRTAWRLAAAVSTMVERLLGHLLVRRAAGRRRRRAVQRRALAMQRQRFARPHHVYDELF